MNIKNKTKLVNIADIKPYKNNAKLHPEHQVESIKQSIEKYDYIQPICVDKNNTIVIGHGRYEAIKQLNGKEKIEVVDLSYLKPKDIKKLRILDNKIISDEWDKDVLQAEIEGIYGGMDDIDSIVGELNISVDELENSGIDDYSDLDNELDDMEGLDTYKILIEIPSKYKDEVLDFIANGDRQTSRGLGRGLLKRCKLL